MMRGIWITITLLAVLAAPAFAVPFVHQEHLVYIDNDCSSCHVPEAKEIKPATEVCLNCHDEAMIKEVSFNGTSTHGPTWALTHRPIAKAHRADALGQFNCSSCHSQEYCLECHTAGFADEQGAFGNNMVNVHRSEFQVSHPIAARTDPQLCTSCHEVRFCSDCHNAFNAGRARTPSHRRTFDLGLNGDIDAIHAGIDATQCDACHLQGSVVPDFFHWSQDHAREARRNLVTCQSCHPEGDICINCHSAVGGAGQFNPHGKGWSDRADRLNDASNGRTCRKCH